MLTIKIITATAIVFAVAGGVEYIGSSLNNDRPSFSASDMDFAWRAAEGPNGERNLQALPLYTAVITQNRSEVERLLGQGMSPNILLHKGCWSLLMIAASQNDRQMVEALLKHGANINYVVSDPVDFSPLSVALNYNIPRQDFSVFHYLLDAGADINATYIDDGNAVNRDGNNQPFTGQDIADDAATLGQMKIVNELLARGYRRDLHQLRETLQIIVNDDETGKAKAIATIDRLLGRQ